MLDEIIFMRPQAGAWERVVKITAKSNNYYASQAGAFEQVVKIRTMSHDYILLTKFGISNIYFYSYILIKTS
jgi:hypothetical protein